MSSLYSAGDRKRRTKPEKDESVEPYRSAWRRDYARLIHCPSFRRLQGKTQVFPGDESDFFRNRLTHSLEVAQIAKSIAIRLNAKAPEFSTSRTAIDTDIVEFAALAHDLGHPPFGHTGEHALDECMRDFGGFEGNAQTLRIVSRLEKKETQRLVNGERKPFDTDGTDIRCGLNVTYRSLAALLKYDEEIPDHGSKRLTVGVQKGYYATDADLVKDIRSNVLGKVAYHPLKTVECSIMDIADDIAYSTYDLEDIFKSNILKPLDLLSLDVGIYKSVSETINKRLKKYYSDIYYEEVTVDEIRSVVIALFTELFYIDDNDKELLKARSVRWEAKKAYFATMVQELSRKMARDGYYRTDFTSDLVQTFLNGIEVKPSDVAPQLHRVRLQLETFIMVEVAKNLTYEAVIQSPVMQVVQFRGKDIVKKIFKALADDKNGTLLPDDFREIHNRGTEADRNRTICDFIAGMTDRYAVEFYSRLYGERGLTMHKPL